MRRLGSYELFFPFIFALRWWNRWSVWTTIMQASDHTAPELISWAIK
jgi:hypothetical protein